MRFWLGGYGPEDGGAATGIGVLRAGAADDPLAGGDLALAGVAVRAASPSWLAAHPHRDVLYAAQEGDGTVRAFARTGAESFAALGGPVAAGAQVCHVAVAPDGASLVASCWGDGRVVHYPLAADGRIGAPVVAPAATDPYDADLYDIDPYDAEPAAGPADGAGLLDLAAFGALPLFGGPDRADAADPAEGTRPAGAADALAGGAGDAVTEPAPRVSRAHQAVFLPGGVVATTDLGFDLVRFWSVAGDGLRELSSVALPRGCGPRHAVWHPSGHLYVVTEVSLEVFVLAPDPAAPPARRWRVVSGSTLGPGTAPGHDAAAEIALTRDGRFVVAGVRGIDALASLRVGDGGSRLAPVAVAESGVAWPRHHVIERDTVLVAGQRSDEVASLALDERTGVVGRVRRRVEAPAPTRLLRDRG